MFRIRVRSLRLLGLAVLAILIAPCLIETWLRIAACRAEMTVSDGESDIETVPSWTTYQQLVPLQRKRLPASLNQIDGTVHDSDGPQSSPVAFRTNSLGLRGREVTTPRLPGGFRILCLGDDTFLGAHTDENLTVPARLAYWLQQRSRTQIEVINAALPDSCPLLSFLQLQHGLLALQPDLIIVNVNLRNAASDRRCRRFTELSADGQPLTCSHPQLAAPKRSRSLSENFLVIRHTERLLSEWLRGTRDQPGSLAAIPASYTGNALTISDEQLSLTLAPLQDLSRLASAIPASLIVTSHPTRSELPQDAETAFPQQVGQFARPRNILFHDATAAFRAADGKATPFLSKTELSPRGHEAYARGLAVAITEFLSNSARSRSQDSGSESQRPARDRRNPVQTTGGTISTGHRSTPPLRSTPPVVRESAEPAAHRKTRLAPFSPRR